MPLWERWSSAAFLIESQIAHIFSSSTQIDGYNNAAYAGKDQQRRPSRHLGFVHVLRARGDVERYRYEELVRIWDAGSGDPKGLDLIWGGRDVGVYK